MAAKKPSAKATKAKKTVAKKADSAKKAAPAKKPAAVAKAKPAPRARPSAKPAAKPAAKPRSPPVAEARVKAPPAPAEVAAVEACTARPAHDSRQADDSSQTRDTPNSTTSTQPAAAMPTTSTARKSPARNLLAGPRNVKPYIPRRGEQYMNKEQLEHFRQILNTWKRDLMHEVDRTVLHMKDEAANFPDPNDRATQESEFSLELRTRDRERKLIRKIEEAIKRIEDGSYGYCVETGEEIGIKRLEARPVATLCVEAQERRERREKQYGDRDDRYR